MNRTDNLSLTKYNREDNIAKKHAIGRLRLPKRLTQALSEYFLENMELKDDSMHSFKQSHTPEKLWQVDFHKMARELPTLYPLTRKDLLEIYGRMNGTPTNSHIWSWEYDDFNHMMMWPTMNFMMRGWLKIEEKLNQLN